MSSETMDPFDSREEDPLLQDDPFAPPPQDSPWGPTEHSNEQEAHHEEQTTQSDPLVSSTANVEGDSVFDSSETKRIVCAEQDAAAGHLGGVQKSLNKGWTLDCVELYPKALDTSSVSLAFVLKRSSTDE